MRICVHIHNGCVEGVTLDQKQGDPIPEVFIVDEDTDGTLRTSVSEHTPSCVSVADMDATIRPRSLDTETLKLWFSNLGLVNGKTEVFVQVWGWDEATGKQVMRYLPIEDVLDSPHHPFIILVAGSRELQLTDEERGL